MGTAKRNKQIMPLPPQGAANGKEMSMSAFSLVTFFFLWIFGIFLIFFGFLFFFSRARDNGWGAQWL